MIYVIIGTYYDGREFGCISKSRLVLLQMYIAITVRVHMSIYLEAGKSYFENIGNEMYPLEQM